MKKTTKRTLTKQTAISGHVMYVNRIGKTLSTYSFNCLFFHGVLHQKWPEWVLINPKTDQTSPSQLNDIVFFKQIRIFKAVILKTHPPFGCLFRTFIELTIFTEDLWVACERKIGQWTKQTTVHYLTRTISLFIWPSSGS